MAKLIVSVIFRYSHNNSLYGPGLTPDVFEGTILPPIFPHFHPDFQHNLGDWTIHNTTLGHGSHGYVHLGTHYRKDCQVAIKSTRPHTSSDMVKQGRLSEMELMKRLHHPNVQGIIDQIKEDRKERVHYVLELMVGDDLFAYLEKHRGLEEKETMFAAWQLVDGLRYLHDHGIAHRGELETSRNGCQRELIS